MNKMTEYRAEIDRIDGEMARLFEARMALSEAVADYKREYALCIRDAEREAALLLRNSARIESKAIESYYVEFMRKVIDLSCAYQSQLMAGMRVAYCGVEGAFAHTAAKRMFPEATLVPFESFSAAYESVEHGEQDCVVLPLENSYAGEVGTVMDLVFSGSLFVNQVLDLDIVHNLIGAKGAALEDIKTVVSHPQALQQCDAYIRAHHFEAVRYSNTALAAQHVLECGDPTVAAIASADTAQIFGLQLLDSRINISRSNTTRFAAFSRAQNRPSAQGRRVDENFILAFTVRNEAGALAQTLNIIGAHGFNMRSLRSRPMKELLWNYFFYIEAEGDINSANGHDMLQELSALCAKLRLVGTYYAGSVG